MTETVGHVLLEEVSMKNVQLQSRIVMAPMTRVFSPDGVPNEEVAAYYRKRAEGGVGLIVTEGTAIDHPSAVMHKDIPRFYGEESLAGWKKVVQEVHAAGGKIIPQLWHVGAARKAGSEPNVEAAPISPSSISLKGKEVPKIHALTNDEVKDLVHQFAKAAKQAKEIGFDGIELHGAHGYLIDQFFWELTNRRDDEYGGNLTGRSTFAADIVRACRAAVGEDFLIVFRYSQWKGTDYEAKLAQNSQELKTLLQPLVEAGVDVFHCSTRRIWEPEFVEEDPDLTLAGWTKRVTGKPAIAVGSIGINKAYRSEHENDTRDLVVSINENIQITEKKIENGEFDYVAIGRSLLADSDWPKKLKENRLEDATMYTKELEETLR
ncbi:NADH:flavin oxidoreductase [Geomicrobium sediminis]|uniref:2,4-dienoyl-CoA reductase-like NADH-dependent reductase (Old Yellow Enzyme family) n=1 Tax=Geomicrobium sediminis TaxID=1347788 RepID=A0ABS2PI86_9BACL|nr:NADH:flavin oxidoreductase [Geomicrobium sediminis]MBM7634977.1 2,4-dienoyl-CoA reductase-like NADH-dependent reductase (Old Yellow Enzyme family) [Geomicrobium sediminis]